jgi:hypothetical protein
MSGAGDAPTPEERKLLATMLRENAAEIDVEVEDGLPSWEARAAEGLVEKGLLRWLRLSGGLGGTPAGAVRSRLCVRYAMTPRGEEEARASLD